ncbi:caspase family protein [Anaeromyxobacter sp. PSR-1]|uniref:caspase family protein n=1 Tax=Anaeromyxobacter sp. PSR-1 TaxID=1300915 RepID=UPI0005E2C8DC|nr:caspase family protein [Anaeromyxobacter sp. PSR-1]GAO04149.1 putative WD repeat-containing protein all2124 [Anaeromyxobacter sp. PSR-1]
MFAPSPSPPRPAAAPPRARRACVLLAALACLAPAAVRAEPPAAPAPPPAGDPGAPAEKGGLVPLDLPRATVAAAHAPKRIALLLGVQRFDDASWRPLRYPDADARALGEALRDPGGFDEVRVLTGATRAEVRDALRALASADRDERDTVVVYVSSHGTLARDAAGQLRRYLVVRDTRLDDVPGTALAMDELNAEFDRLRSRRKVLVLATCHSGGGKSLLPEEVRRELEATKAGFLVRPIEEVSRASTVLAASDWGETAREDERLGHDIYTYFLVEALRSGADRNGDGAVTASEAHDYARRRTYAYTAGRQRPSAESTEVGADPIVLVGRVERKGKPELYSYATRLDGFTVSVDGRPLAELPGGVVLEPGRSRVQLAKGGGPALLDRTVSLDPGERVDVVTLLERAQGRWEAAPRVALLAFLDARSRREVLGPVPGFGGAFTARGWPAPSLSLRLDLVTSFGRSRIRQDGAEATFDYTALAAGVGVPWRFEPAALRGAALLAGPRLSLLWLDRRFDLALAPPAQRVLTFTPGLLLGAAVPLGRGFTAGAELHLDWLLLRVDRENRSTGLAELLVGAGYRF